jgi:PAS domain S-box-containing protein
LSEVTKAAASLEAILDCVALPVWVVDQGGRVLFANPAALTAFGFELHELQGRNGHSMVHYKRPDGSPYPASECPILRPSRSGETSSGDDWFVRRDGSLFPVSYTAVPIELSAGRGVVLTFVDMTAQREAEQGMRERDAILARTSQPVWVVDQRGTFRYVNPAAAAALGYDDPSELVGRPGHDTVHYKYPDGTPFPEADCPVARARWSGETGQEDVSWLVRKDGSIMRISYATAPFELADGLGAVTAFTDIEEHLEAERARRERDVADARAAELKRARRRIIEAADAARARLTRDLHDGAQQQFVSAVLTLSLAERKCDADPDGAARLRQTALEQAQHGIAELRDLAAGIHPGILTDRGLGPAVEALATRLPLPVTVDASIDARLPPPVEASVYFFVSEALTNAVKHSRAEEVRVSIAADAGRLTVDVADDGVGGAMDAPVGTGMASLADRVAALDGELTVTSPPGRGTTLHAEVPIT